MATSILRPFAVLLAAMLLHAAHAAEEGPPPWPAKVVTIEQLRPLAPIQLKVPGLVVKGGVKGPAILRVHVDGKGEVVRISLLDSSGNADLDEAAMHAMREVRFRPYAFGGVPMDVTLVVPFHIPKEFGRSH